MREARNYGSRRAASTRDGLRLMLERRCAWEIHARKISCTGLTPPVLHTALTSREQQQMLQEIGCSRMGPGLPDGHRRRWMQSWKAVHRKYTSIDSRVQFRAASVRHPLCWPRHSNSRAPREHNLVFRTYTGSSPLRSHTGPPPPPTSDPRHSLADALHHCLSDRARRWGQQARSCLQGRCWGRSCRHSQPLVAILGTGAAAAEAGPP